MKSSRTRKARSSNFAAPPISTAKPAARRRDAKSTGTIHWVSAAHAVAAEVRLYDRLFTAPEPDAEGDFKKHLNPHSLEVVTAKCEPSLREAKPELRYQFERLGYFTLDKDSAVGKIVLNRTITLKDAWAKEATEEQIAAYELEHRASSCSGSRSSLGQSRPGTKQSRQMA